MQPRSRTATVHRPSAGAATYSGADKLALDDILPGFSPALAEIFD